MYFDGSLKLEGAGVGVLLISPKGEQLKYALQIFWMVSNNEAEYEALLHGLRLTLSQGIKRLLVYTTLQWSSTKLTSLGIATRRTWMPTA
jgi:ribonuclease HI